MNAPQNITHILFDLGNVLVGLRPIDTIAIMCPALLAANETIRPIVEDYECGRMTTELFFQKAPVELGLDISPDELRARFKAIVGEWYDTTPILLQTLRQHVHLGCLSNTNPMHIEALRERGPFLDLLHDCFFSHDIGCMKPDLIAYDRVVQQWTALPRQILFLDDRLENVIAARKYGMQARHTIGPQAVLQACAEALSMPELLVRVQPR